MTLLITGVVIYVITFTNMLIAAERGNFSAANTWQMLFVIVSFVLGITFITMGALRVYRRVK